MNRVLVIDCKDSFVYNIIEVLRQENICHDVVEIENLSIPMMFDFSAAIISPGGGTPSLYPNIIRFIDYYYQKVPILGICLGLQAIGSYFGDELYQLDRPLHGCSAYLSLTPPKDPIFEGIDDNCEVGLYHSWAVKQSKLSPLRTIATDERGIVMAVRHKTLPIYGFQFHPESIISGANGRKMLSNWVKMIKERQRS